VAAPDGLGLASVPTRSEFQVHIGVLSLGRVTSRGVPLCGCQRHFGLRWAVKPAIAQHGEQDVTATSCKRDEGLVMALSLTDLAGVVGPGDRIAQSRERRQEHRTFELFVSPPGGLLTADGRAGATGHRGKACIGRQMARRSKCAARHVDQESGCGPDADSPCS
jgi:hypothetical protein